MNTEELRKKSVTELNEELKSLLREQFLLRMDKGMGEASRPHQFKDVRRSIARVKTLLNEKERTV